MRTLKLTLAYDGAAYRGWQRQDAGPSIQGLVEEALSRLEGTRVTIVGAGRTDAGVHALGQVARATLSGRHDAPTVQRALNAILPADIRVVSAEDVPETFHPRIDARAKRYQYWIWDAPVLPPAIRSWCWHVPRRLDVEAMDAAASLLVGHHDFAAFRSTGTDVATTVRTMTHAGVRALAVDDDPSPVTRRLVPSDGRFVVLDVEADGFLRHMVRAIAGTLVEIGEGRRDPSGITDLLAGGERHAAGPTAPPEGLVLVRVRY